MRSIVGPLLFGLLPLIAVGCMLPERSMGRAEDLGFRPRNSKPPRGSSESPSPESISFNPTSKNRPLPYEDSDSQNQTTPESTGLVSGPNSADRSLWVAGHSSDTMSSSLDRGTWPSTTDVSPKSPPTGDAEQAAQPEKLSSFRPVAHQSSLRQDTTRLRHEKSGDGVRNAGYRSDVDEIANPIQQQNMELAQPDSKSKKPSRQLDPGESPVDQSRSGSNPAKKADVSTSSVPMWSERPMDRNAVKQAAVSVNSKSPAGVRQISQTDATSNRSRSASTGSLPSLPWQAELDQLISQIERDLGQTKPIADGENADGGLPNETFRKHAHLRLLYLMAQRQEEAMTAIPGVDAFQQEYWQQMVWAMSNTFDTVQFPAPSERASQVVPPLSSALRQMREQAALSIKNMTFCRKISYFGNYERFPRNDFTAGHEVLLYTEIENFVSAPTADGEYRTSLKSLIEIADSRGKTVWTKGFPSTEDFCRNPRRDYFHNYQFYIPEDLSTGAYTLKLTIVDELSRATPIR